MCESGRRLDPAVPQAAMSDEQPPKRTLVFTYGALKHDFSNHPLLQELALSGDASFASAAVLSHLSARPPSPGSSTRPAAAGLPTKRQREEGGRG